MSILLIVSSFSMLFHFYSPFQMATLPRASILILFDALQNHHSESNGPLNRVYQQWHGPLLDFGRIWQTILIIIPLFERDCNCLGHLFIFLKLVSGGQAMQQELQYVTFLNHIFDILRPLVTHQQTYVLTGHNDITVMVCGSCQRIKRVHTSVTSNNSVCIHENMTIGHFYSIHFSWWLFYLFICWEECLL